MNVSLPIVPMLDMSFQLLFFFIITFSPGQPEGQIALNLPAPHTSNAVPQGAPEVFDLPADRTVSIRVIDGKLSLTLIESDRLTELNGLDDLVGRLKATHDDNLRIRADDRVH